MGKTKTRLFDEELNDDGKPTGYFVFHTTEVPDDGYEEIQATLVDIELAKRRIALENYEDYLELMEKERDAYT